MDTLDRACDTHPMATKAEKKAEAERNARDIYSRLMALARDPGMSNNEWTTKARVSSSFFSNMQGNTRSPSEPTVGNLRRVLRVVGLSLSEFFLDEAEGKIARMPSQDDLVARLRQVLPSLPDDQDEQVTLIAEAIMDLLRNPPDPD